MNKKIVLAIAALGFGLSLNISAANNCQLECELSYYYCVGENYDEAKCDDALRQCDECLTF